MSTHIGTLLLVIQIVYVLLAYRHFIEKSKTTAKWGWQQWVFGPPVVATGIWIVSEMFYWTVTLLIV